MKYCLTLIVLLMAMSNALGEKPMQCNIGPVDKYYGGTKWIVYSCADKSTLVIYSYPDNPASPFYFMFYIKDGSYQLYGEGTGNKEYTKATSVELGKPDNCINTSAFFKKTALFIDSGVCGDSTA